MEFKGAKIDFDRYGPQDETSYISDGYHTFGELYEHRYALFIALMHCMQGAAWYSMKHANDVPMYNGWFIAGICLPSGDISYHLPLSLLGHVQEAGAKRMESGFIWDGHTSEDVIDRLYSFRHNQRRTLEFDR